MLRQPKWVTWVLLFSASCTFASVMLGDPDDGFGGPALHFVVLFGSGALIVLCVTLLLLRRGRP